MNRRTGVDGRARRSGFTIVEIIVVVIIISALAALIAPRFFGRVGQAKQSIAKQKIAEIDKAIELFGSEYGRLPKELDELLTRPADVPEEKWQTPTLREKDLLDPWGRRFLYRVPGEAGRSFELMSLGADGEPGGDKENKDVNNWEP